MVRESRIGFVIRDIQVGTDLEAMAKLRPDRTMTSWCPKFFSTGTQFWLEGKADGDTTAFVIAARLFTGINLKEELETLRVFYLNPENRQDLCEVRLPSNVRQIEGNFGHTGNLWVAPAFRGQGLAGFATRALHREILRRWDVDWIWGLQEREIAYKGLWQDQLYAHCEGDVTWSGNPYAREFRMKIVYSSREEMEQALATQSL